jgi:hypothetical protein
MRVGDVALLAVYGQAPAQRAAPTVLDDIAEPGVRGRFAHQTIVDMLAARREPIDHLDGAVDRRAFFVGGDQQADRALMVGMLPDKILDRGDERRQRALHVGGAAPVQQSVAHLRRERVARPLPARAGRHHVGVAGERQQRLDGAAPRPEVVDLAEAQALDLEPERFEARDHQFLTALVLRRDRWPGDQLLGEFQGFIGHTIF